MTPEQLQQYVDAALKQRDQFSLVFYPLTIVLSIGGAWLISYVREKGKNLATKEDISDITQKVESIKTDLATKQHFSQVRYEREMKVYEELWPKLCVLREAVLSLRPVMDSGLKPGETEETRKQARAQKFGDAYMELSKIAEHSRPFYPPEIWSELRNLLDVCWGEAVGFRFTDLHQDFQKYWDDALANSKKITDQVNKLSEVIRSRLSKFD
jgi:hypothetical protein